MNGNCDRLGWDFVQVCEPALADLLTPAGIVQIDNQVGIFGLEIGGWVVERQVTVLADARKGEMNGSGGDGSSQARDRFSGWTQTIYQVVIRYAGGHDDSLTDISGKARWVVDADAKVFVQVEKLNTFPGDGGIRSEVLEKLQL